MSNLIRFAEGIHVEITHAPAMQAVSSAQSTRLDNQRFAQAVQAIHSCLRPIVDAVQSTIESTRVKEAELTLGFTFSAEGNLFLTKASAESNLEVKVVFEPKARAT